MEQEDSNKRKLFYMLQNKTDIESNFEKPTVKKRHQPASRTNSDETKVDHENQSNFLEYIPCCSRSFCAQPPGMSTYFQNFEGFSAEHSWYNEPYKLPEHRATSYKAGCEINNWSLVQRPRQCYDESRQYTTTQGRYPSMNINLSMNMNLDLYSNQFHPFPIYYDKTQQYHCHIPSYSCGPTVFERPFTCSKKSWRYTSNMYDRYDNNTCNICGKIYARPSTLKTHMRTHSGERPYKCSVCNKCFSQTANLRAHLRTHTGEKPYLCQICHRKFSQSSSVTTHMRVHSGERPYRCRICHKCFSDSSTLTKHSRIHSGEKPYHCSVCQLQFSQSGNLNRHMKIHSAAEGGASRKEI